MIKYFAEKGYNSNLKTKIFDTLDELFQSGFDYDYFHKINILETHKSERYIKELTKRKLK